MKMVIKARLEKAKRAAIKHDWCYADDELQKMLLQTTDDEQQSIGLALLLLATDCEKLKLSEIALWAYAWVVKVTPTHAAPYLRLAAHYERIGQRQTALEWLKRGIEMDATSGGGGIQQLQRTYRRLYAGS